MFNNNNNQCPKLRPFWSPWRVEKSGGESQVMAAILQLKVAKRWLFEKVSLERCLLVDCILKCGVNHSWECTSASYERFHDH